MTGVKKFRKLAGFTLMETLVALGVFTVVITIATDLFLTFQRVSRKTEGLELLTSGARFAIERIVREVREGVIDYERYDSAGIALSASQSQNVLYMRDNLGNSLAFRFSDCSAQYEGNDCITLSANGQEEAIVGAAIYVRDARFYIIPPENPFLFVTDPQDERSGQYAGNVQPRVTIFLALDNGRALHAQDYVRYETQTTVSSRSYLR